MARLLCLPRFGGKRATCGSCCHATVLESRQIDHVAGAIAWVVGLRESRGKEHDAECAAHKKSFHWCYLRNFLMAPTAPAIGPVSGKWEAARSCAFSKLLILFS